MLGRVFLEFFVMDVHAEIYHANVAGLEDTLQKQYLNVRKDQHLY